MADGRHVICHCVRWGFPVFLSVNVSMLNYSETELKIYSGNTQSRNATYEHKCTSTTSVQFWTPIQAGPVR